VAEPNASPDPEVSERVAEAHRAHARGWLLTPIRGKAPYLKSWQSQPPPDIAKVSAWAEAGNFGVRTGMESGVVVIDDDTDDGSAAATLDLPPTPTVLTGGGGKHHYFRAPSMPIGNSASKLADKVDVKGEKGVVVAAGSIHPETGKPYTWAPGLSRGGPAG
jgi:Bifunctional DNA primase/polymerase, N-terminal